MNKVGDFLTGHPVVLFLTGVALGFAICYYMPDNWFPGAATPAAPAAPAAKATS